MHFGWMNGCSQCTEECKGWLRDEKLERGNKGIELLDDDKRYERLEMEEQADDVMENLGISGAFPLDFISSPLLPCKWSNALI
jgi:hypothetical protein